MVFAGTGDENTELWNESEVFSLLPGTGSEYISKEFSLNVCRVAGL